jgi:hypothetical protein
VAELGCDCGCDCSCGQRCSLDEHELQAQLSGYRAVGADAHLIERDAHRIAVELARDVDPAEVERLLAVERQCCPFIEIVWDPASRRLSFSTTEHGPALAAIVAALQI